MISINSPLQVTHHSHHSYGTGERRRRKYSSCRVLILCNGQVGKIHKGVMVMLGHISHGSTGIVTTSFLPSRSLRLGMCIMFFLFGSPPLVFLIASFSALPSSYSLRYFFSHFCRHDLGFPCVVSQRILSLLFLFILLLPFYFTRASYLSLNRPVKVMLQLISTFPRLFT